VGVGLTPWKYPSERLVSAGKEGMKREQDSGNHRNGYGSKTVVTDTGKLELSIPRDRHGRFDPALIPNIGAVSPGSTTRSSRCTRAA